AAAAEKRGRLARRACERGSGDGGRSRLARSRRRMTDDRAADLTESRAFSPRVLVVALLGLVAAVGVAAAALSMLWPSTEPFYAARVADLEPLVPQHFPNEGFWLVLLEDGEVHAFHD